MDVARIGSGIALAALCLLVGCQNTASPEATDAPVVSANPQITFGDGEANWIVVEGVRRDGATFTFREVKIDGNGWLVLHPFENGRPNGMIYSGATYLSDGESQGVSVTVDETPISGDRFLVMLHRDVNEDRKFDFVFVDEHNVLDKAVFEGAKMIAHAIAAP